MKRRLFLYTAITILVGFMGFFGASVYTVHTDNLNMRNNSLNSAKDAVAEIAQICADMYAGGADALSVVSVGQEARLTVISPDGMVLANNHHHALDPLENHLNLAEIQAAVYGYPAASVVSSDTPGIDLVCYALKMDSGESYVFIRVAMPVAGVDTSLLQPLPLFLFLLMSAVLFAFFFTRAMADRITRPLEAVWQRVRLLANGEYMPESAGGKYNEVDKAMGDVDEIAQILQHSFDALREEKNKAEYILGNIGDGLFAVDENKNIVLINSAALEIFNVTQDIVNKNLNYLTFDKTLAGAIDDCIDSAKDTMLEITVSGRIFLVMVKSPPDTKLTMVVLSDVTESHENAKRREEFFANASHELKTPLTAIKGFNELAALNSKDESISKYIAGITRETDRMLALLGDMLRLSELENTRGINPIPVSLAKVVDEVREAIDGAAREKAITMDVAGDGMVAAETEHVYELVKNLIENAVRYNNPGGAVTITMKSDRKAVRLCVSDNGIGIPPEEQARVFERFYRVEKSRSQRGGGTGLGLSIVKHICALYGWKLSLKSKLGVGTEVTVEFGT